MKDLRFFWREFFPLSNRPRRVKLRRNVSKRELCLVFFSLALMYLSWYCFYRVGPLAAYYELASAFESANIAQVQKLTSSYSPAQLKEIVRPYGGMRAFGKSMKRAPQVEVFTHMVFTTDTYSMVGNTPLLLQFHWNPSPRKPNQWCVSLIAPGTWFLASNSQDDLPPSKVDSSRSPS